MTYQEIIAAAVAEVDKVFAKALRIARENSLAILVNTKSSPKGEYWTKVLKLDGDQPEYRIGYSVTFANQPHEDRKPGTAHIWMLVTDLKDGSWHRADRENIAIADLAVAIDETLTTFEQWIKDNEGLDPLEEARKQAGTAYYWEHHHEDGWFEYTTDFPNGMSGQVQGSDDFEGELLDADGEVLQTWQGDHSLELMLKVEAEYKKRAG